MNSTYLKTLRNGAFATGIAVITGSAFIATPTPAYAIYCSNCSTVYQQVFQYAKEVETALNTAQQLSTQIQQYENMVQQGVSLPSRIFSQITSDLSKVTAVYNNAQSLGRTLSTLDSQFSSQFEGYEKYLQNVTNSSTSMPSRYKTWSQQGFDAAKTAMKAAGINVDTFSDENTTLDEIVARSQSATGRQQAIQAGNEIAAQNVQQLQKLRDLVATQITLQGNALATQTEQRAVDDAFREKFNSGTVHGTGASKGY